jgi:hypothetical protein
MVGRVAPALVNLADSVHPIALQRKPLSSIRIIKTTELPRNAPKRIYACPLSDLEPFSLSPRRRAFRACRPKTGLPCKAIRRCLFPAH